MKVIKFGADWCSACKAMDLIFTDESKRKISESHKGMKLSDETKTKIEHLLNEL